MSGERGLSRGRVCHLMTLPGRAVSSRTRALPMRWPGQGIGVERFHAFGIHGQGKPASPASAPFKTCSPKSRRRTGSLTRAKQCLKTGRQP